MSSGSTGAPPRRRKVIVRKIDPASPGAANTPFDTSRKSTPPPPPAALRQAPSTMPPPPPEQGVRPPFPSNAAATNGLPRREGNSTPPIATTLSPPATVRDRAATRRVAPGWSGAAIGALSGLAIVAAFVGGVRFGQRPTAAPATLPASAGAGVKEAPPPPSLEAPISFGEPRTPISPTTAPPKVAPSPTFARARTAVPSSLAVPSPKPSASAESGAAAQRASEPGTEQAPSASPEEGTPPLVPATPSANLVEDPLVEAVRKDIAEEEQSRRR
jgi:hypothetical protein